MEQTKCGIYNALHKFRPDLRDEMEQIPGRDVQASVDFLRSKDLFDREAEILLNAMMRAMGVWQAGPDEWSFDRMKKAQDKLMCHVAKLIKNSAT